MELDIVTAFTMFAAEDTFEDEVGAGVVTREEAELSVNLM